MAETSADMSSSDQKSESPVVEDGKEEERSSEIDSELLVKHPTHNTWALWYFKNDRSRDWNENLKLVAKFQFVEDFWALYNHIMPASKLSMGCDYSVFKDGIEPAWEDPQNKKGGRWLVGIQKHQRHAELDNFWRETLMCLIGEAFEEHSDEVCGAVVNVRTKGDKIALWTRDAANKEATLAIGKKLKERLGVPKSFQIGYQMHDDSISKTGSITRNKYQI